MAPTTTAADEVRRSLFATLEHEPRVNLHDDHVELEFSDGIATLSGEVASIAAKRLTLLAAAALPAVTGIADRLRTRPANVMGDGEIADHLERALAAESSFDEISISRRVGNEPRQVRQAPGPRAFEYRVEDGVVTLDGEVPSLSHKRLAGVLAWWIPGTRDVVNGLGVDPPEEDSEQEILDALRLVLEKDRFVDALEIRASCVRGVITLEGLVASESQKEFAEYDAWALFGVDEVINRIVVKAS